MASSASLERVKSIIPQLQVDFPGADVMMLGVPHLMPGPVRAFSPTRAADSLEALRSSPGPSSHHPAPISLGFARSRNPSNDLPKNEFVRRPRYLSNDVISDSPVGSFQDLTFSMAESYNPESSSTATNLSPRTTVSSDGFADTTFSPTTNTQMAAEPSTHTPVSFASSVTSNTSTFSPQSSSIPSSNPESTSNQSPSPAFRWKSRHMPSTKSLSPESQQLQILLKSAIERAHEAAHQLGVTFVCAPEQDPQFIVQSASVASSSIPFNSLANSTRFSNSPPQVSPESRLSPRREAPTSGPSSPRQGSPLTASLIAPTSGTHNITSNSIDTIATSASTPSAPTPESQSIDIGESKSQYPSNDTTEEHISPTAQSPSAIAQSPLARAPTPQELEQQSSNSATAGTSPPTTSSVLGGTYAGMATMLQTNAQTLSSSLPMSPSLNPLQIAAAASQVITFFEQLACNYQPPWFKSVIASYRKLGMDISITDRKTVAIVDVWRQYYSKGSDYVTALALVDLGLRSPLPEFVAQLTNVQTINLSGNNLNETHIKTLFTLPQVGILNLRNNQLKKLPAEVGRLSELYELDISYNQLETLPSQIENCSNLAKLNVQSNSLLTLPFGLAKLPIMTLVVGDNPLSTIPPKYRVDSKALWAYLEQSLNNPTMERWTRLRLMVVGPENIGKTRIVRRLARKEYAPISTDGIEVETFKMKLSKASARANESKATQVDLRVYDFGGQEVFYPTHSFFIGPRSLYLAVFKLMPDVDSINWHSLEYWLRTIKLLGSSETSGKPSVIVVGTHLDELESRAPSDTQKDLLNAITKRIQLMDSLVHLRNIVFVSTKTKKGLDALRNAILQRAEKEDVLKTPVPSSWIAMDTFLNCLIQTHTFTVTPSGQTVIKANVESSSSESKLFPLLRGLTSATPQQPTTMQQSLRFITWQAFCDYAAMFNVTSEKEVKEMANLLHDMGSILWYNATMMKEVVILDPQWLSEVMASIISMKVRLRDGELHHSALANMWKAYPASLHQTLLSFLEHFEVAYPLKGTDKTIVPCMFSSEPGDTFKAELAVINANTEKSPKYQRNYRFKGFLPLGFFDRMIVRIMHIQGLKLTSSWRYGIIMRMGPATGWVSFETSKKILQIVVLARSNSDILFPSILDSIESLIKTTYRNLKINRRIVTSLVSALQPDEFDYDTVLDAFNRGERTFMAGKVALPIEDLAPDITMSFVPELANVKIGEVIGSGGFGVVHKGTWNGTEVAVKEVLFKSSVSSANTETFRQFAHEAWIMSRLSHPNLVHLFGITLHPLRMIMEFCPGMDLFKFLTVNPKMATDPAQALLRLRIAIDVAKGMQHLHNLSPPVIHRDLRSPNVFVVTTDDNAEAVAKIGDFGLAEFTAHGLNEALPTWQWLPPETFNAIANYKYSESSDRWSYGIVLWEIYTASEPFSEYFNDPRFADQPDSPLFRTDAPLSSKIVESPSPPSLMASTSSIASSDKEPTSSSSSNAPSLNSSANNLIPPLVGTINNTGSPPNGTVPPTNTNNDAQPATNLKLSEAFGFSHTDMPYPKSARQSGFTMCNVHALKNAIAEQGLRPTIPAHIPAAVREVITRCWDADPSKRPDFGQILNILAAEATEAGMQDIAPPASILQRAGPSASVTQWRVTAASQRSNYFRQPITKSLHSTIPLESGVLSLAFNPVRNEIWSGCSDGQVRIFNSKTRVRNVEILPVSSSGSSNGRIHQLIYTKGDFPKIWSCSDRIVVWNPESRLLEKELFVPHTNIVRSMLYLESKNQVWTADVNGLVCVWDASTFGLIHTITCPLLTNTPVFCMCLVDENAIWLGCNSKIVVIDAETFQGIDKWDAHFGYRIMAMIVAGNHVWTGSELRICVWDKKTRQPVTDPNGNKVERHVEFGVVSMISVKRPNEVVHVWSGDSNGTVTVWNADITKPGLAIFQILNNHRKDSIHAILELDDSNTICSGSYGNPNSKSKDNSICLWQYE